MFRATTKKTTEEEGEEEEKKKKKKRAMRCLCCALPKLTKTNHEEEEAGGGEENTSSFLTKCALGMIDFYRNELSPFMPKSCRYVPSCSNYAFEAYSKYGVGKGFVLTAWRILRCNPLGGSGYDPPRWPPSFIK